MTTRKVTKKMSMPSKKPARPSSVLKLIRALEASTKKQFAAIDRRFEALSADIEHRFAGLDRRLAANNQELRRDFEAIAARLLKAQQESFRSQFGALDDKYRDIPARVEALEDRVGITR